MDAASDSPTLLRSPSILLFGVFENNSKTTSKTGFEINIDLCAERHHGRGSKPAGNSWAEEFASLR
jgi:hypothetical protein